MTSTSPSAYNAARRVVGGLFTLTGLFKVLVWPRFFAFCAQLAPQVLKGTPALAPLRAALFLTALIVPPLEVIGGVFLWRGRRVRLSSALLVLDMLGAIASVGVPGRLGKSTAVAGMKIGDETWRLPLEMTLLLACAWLATRRPGSK